MTERSLRVAVVGCGDIAAVHLAAIDQEAEAVLVAVCDPDDGRRSAAAERWRVPGHRSMTELLAAESPDVVHICTPHVTHVPLAIEALEAGVHVVLEKPVAHTREAARLLAAAAERSSARIAVCFQNRYNAPVVAAKRIIDSGELGAVQGAAATLLWHRDAGYYRARPWRGRWDGGAGGLLMNQAIHTVDLVQWLVGPVERTVGGASTRLLGDVIEVEDTADLVLAHRGGARSTLFATLSHVVNAPIAVDLVADRGTLALRGDLTVVRADGGVEVVPEATSVTGDRAYWGASHGLLIADFYEHVRDGRSFWIDVPAATAAFEIVQSVYDQSYPDRPR